MDFCLRRIYFEITNACNLSCRYCFVDKKISKNILKAKKIFQVLDEVAPAYPRITFSGSEPFMRSDIFEIMGFAKDRGLSVDLYSNGTLISKKIADFLTLKEIKSIRISLDGPESINDFIRGKGVFQKVVRALDLIYFYKKKYNSVYPYVILSPVISEKNVDFLETLVDIAVSSHVNEVDYLTLVWLDKKMAELNKKELKERLGLKSSYASGLVNGMSGIDFEKYSLKIMEVKKAAKKKNISIGFWQLSDQKNIASAWYSPDGSGIIKGCGFIYDTARIDQEGNVISCPLIRYKYGNLKDKSLLEILNGERAVFFRNEISKCLFPICFKCHRALVK